MVDALINTEQFVPLREIFTEFQRKKQAILRDSANSLLFHVGYINAGNFSNRVMLSLGTGAGGESIYIESTNLKMGSSRPIMEIEERVCVIDWKSKKVDVVDFSYKKGVSVRTYTNVSQEAMDHLQERRDARFLRTHIREQMDRKSQTYQISDEGLELGDRRVLTIFEQMNRSLQGFNFQEEETRKYMDASPYGREEVREVPFSERSQQKSRKDASIRFDDILDQ